MRCSVGVRRLIIAQLDNPEHEILVIGSQESDSDAREKICTAISRLASGKYGKKVLLKVEETQ